MNLTIEILSSLIIVAFGIYVTQRVQHDYKLVNIFRQYTLPGVIRPGGIIDLSKLKIFVQNFNYKIETNGNLVLEVKNDIINVISGTGSITIVFEAWGFLGFYRIARSIKVIT